MAQQTREAEAVPVRRHAGRVEKADAVSLASTYSRPAAGRLAASDQFQTLIAVLAPFTSSTCRSRPLAVKIAAYDSMQQCRLVHRAYPSVRGVTDATAPTRAGYEARAR